MRNIAIMLVAIALCIAAGCEEKFQILDVSPPSGTLGGGEPVVIRGTGFNQNLGIAVYFGNVKADNVVVGSTNKLTVATPSSGEPKTVDVRIATDDGKEYLIKRGFRYIEKSSMDIRDLGKRKSKREKPE